VKKIHRKDQRDARLRSPVRELRLQALLFGGAAAAPDGAVRHSSLIASGELVKFPNAAGE
jgi:hypothetical protein